MARRLIGTGITNAQGIAIMNKDAQGETITGYTGVGAGKLQIIAESGTLQSEIYELIDATFLDEGTSTSYNNNWLGGNVTTRTRNTTDTTLTITDTSSSSVVTGINFYDNECIEFDANLSNVSDIALSIRKGSSNYNQSTFEDLGCSSGTYYHIKVTAVDGVLTFYVDGTSVRVRTITNDHQVFYIRLANNASMNYKNFMKYPI